MHRTLFEIPIPLLGKIIPIYSYGFMMAVGFFIALFTARWRAKKEGIDPILISDLGIYLICAGIIGARAFFVIQNIGEYKGNLLDIFKIYEGGLVFYGGLIAGVCALFVFVMKKGLPFLKAMDAVFPSAALGLAFGRIGCFLNGCCFGELAGPCVFCGVRFPKTIDAYGRIDGSPVFLHHLENGLVSAADGCSLPVHPTQIYEFVACVAIFFVLNTFYSYRKRDGEVMLLFGIVYTAYRFFIEFLRADSPPILFDTLTISQGISIAIFLISLPMFVVRRARLKA